MSELQIVFVGDVLMEEGKSEEAWKLYELSKDEKVRVRLINTLTENKLEEAWKLSEESDFEKPVLESEE